MQVRLALPIAVCAALLTAGVPALAHHAVQASVDINVNVEAKGILTKVDWINPHTWMHFDVTLPDGTLQKNVMVESLGINAFRKFGITSSAVLKVGEVYDITYYPMRTGEPGGFMSRMVMPDGYVFDTKTADPTAIPDQK